MEARKVKAMKKCATKRKLKFMHCKKYKRSTQFKSKINYLKDKRILIQTTKTKLSEIC